MPKVAVIIPNYNHARFLDQRIRSVLSQSFQDFEIILLDDASTDNSRQIIACYEGDPRIRIVLNPNNSGSPCHQWNQGITLTSAPYVWIAETDDNAEPDLLATLVGKLDSNPGVVLAYTQSYRIDENDQPCGDLNDWTADLDADRWRHDYINDGRDECARFLIMKNTIPNASAVVFRRNAFLQAGTAHEGMRLCGDWMTWSRLLMQGDLMFVAKPLNLFRAHSSTVRSTTSAYQFVSESLEVTRFIIEQVSMSHADRSRVARSVRSHWWNVLRNHSFPKWSEQLQIARKASSLGNWLPVKLLALVPLALIARSPIVAPLLRLKRKITS